MKKLNSLLCFALFISLLVACQKEELVELPTQETEIVPGVPVKAFSETMTLYDAQKQNSVEIVISSDDQALLQSYLEEISIEVTPLFERPITTARAATEFERPETEMLDIALVVTDDKLEERAIGFTLTFHNNFKGTSGSTGHPTYNMLKTYMAFTNLSANAFNVEFADYDPVSTTWAASQINTISNGETAVAEKTGGGLCGVGMGVDINDYGISFYD